MTNPSRAHLTVAVSFDDRFVTCRRLDGTTQEITWETLRSVEIRTSDAGPFEDDVFLVLHGDDGECVISQEAEGFGELLERLQALPGFDNEAVIAAMSCTDNAPFPCWRKPED